MQAIDWLVVLVYLVLSLALGLWLSRRASKNVEEFFLSGRSLPWWLAGTSMAATTFSIDTPLYVAGIVATRGIAGNWEWWSFGIAHLVLVYVFARLWRRSEVVTDAELTELRYGGATAAWLRGVKAFLFAVPLNCIGIGYAMLAMVKTVDALQLWQSLGVEPAEATKLWSVVGVSVFVLIYSGFSGLWGVVTTDFLQFFLALAGAIVVAIVAVVDLGGMGPLLERAQAATDQDVLGFLPLTWEGWGSGIAWNEAAGISASTFAAYLGIQWWAFRRSDGGGEFVQRLLASKDEAEAQKAAWWFNILHYGVRTWPWIVVALAAIALYPDLADPEQGYPLLMLEFLPPILLGVVVASLIAAFMSTVSTSINWGASYLTTDLYQRFMRPEAPQAELVLVGRIASVLVTGLGAIAAFYSDDVATVFRLVIAIGTGPGAVLILRWFWWRVNGAAELAAMVSGLVVGWATSAVEELKIEDFGLRLLVTAGLSAAIWLTVLALTPPESDETLDRFYTKVRPPGPGWRRQRDRTGLAPLGDLRIDLLRVVAGVLLLFGVTFAIGGFLLWQSLTGWLSLAIAAIGAMWLRSLNRQGRRVEG
ncbi:MAG: Na+:solute symporter [Cyanobacteria bacterium]|nr:Na+:solute symporter [Cyanobacteriota bacterium]